MSVTLLKAIIRNLDISGIPSTFFPVGFITRRIFNRAMISLSEGLGNKVTIKLYKYLIT